MGRSEGWQPTDFGDQNPQTYEPDGSSDAEVREGDLINMSNRVLDEYARAKVVVVPLDTSTGINDAMGSTALFEAMAMGKAIVATDTHTMRSHITHDENGLLVPEGDVAAMRRSIQELLNDADRRARLGRAARAYAIEHLDAEKLTGKLAEYFKKLVAGKH